MVSVSMWKWCNRDNRLTFWPELIASVTLSACFSLGTGHFSCCCWLNSSYSLTVSAREELLAHNTVIKDSAFLWDIVLSFCPQIKAEFWIRSLLMGQQWQAFNNIPPTCFQLIKFLLFQNHQECVHLTAFVMAVIQPSAIILRCFIWYGCLRSRDIN